MIRKRDSLEDSPPLKNEDESVYKQPENINPSLRKEFKTFQEEAIYVIKLLKEQGIDIYEPDRYGGMYLNNGKNKMNKIFGKTNPKKETKDQEVNTIDNSQLSNFFKK